MQKIREYRSKGKVYGWNPWNWDAEPGDLMVNNLGQLFRIAKSRGRNKAAAGDLTPVLIKPPSPELCAAIIDGRVWWVKKEEK